MNFDYLKNVERLNKAYYCCSNAEELAISKPDLSIFSSRKSAEQIAKFVYFVAYSEDSEEIPFFDILNDPVVKGYLKNKTVLDAFHFIRRNGNTAVHKIDEKSADEAIEVLKKLYYVVGEVAKRMKLIKDYPPFKDNLTEHPDAEPLDDEFYGNLAKEMYDEYVISQHRIDVLKAQFSELSSPYRFSHGNVDEYEIVEFENKPESYSTVNKIQEYFGTIGNHALETIFDANDEHILPYRLELSIYGEDGYTTNDIFEAIKGVLYDIPQSEGFRIVSYYSGSELSSLFEDYHGNMNLQNLSDFINIKDTESYKRFEFLYNHGTGGCVKYEDNDWVDLPQLYSDKIVDKDFGIDWWCQSIDFVIDLDHEKYSHIFALLHEVVRECVPQDQQEYCEQNWNGENTEPEILLDSIQWSSRTLREVQLFLDKINEIIAPIKDEIRYTFEGEWFITKDPFAVATCVWMDGGFKIIGTEL